MKNTFLLTKLFSIICLLSLSLFLHAEENGPCAIESMNIEFLACNEDGTYNVELYYTVLNPVGDSLSLFINSEHHGDFLIGGSLTIENVQPSELFDNDLFFLCMTEDEDCNISMNFVQPECDCIGPCEIEDIQVLTLDCDPSTGTYTAQIFYTVSNPDHDVVHVSINNVDYGEFPVGSQILIDGISPRPNSVYDIVEICAAEECCSAYEYIPEDCGENNGECGISNIEIVEYVCSSVGTYSAIWINYDFINPIDSTVHVILNEEYIGAWPLGQTISFDVVSLDEVLELILVMGDSCFETLVFDNVCGDECNWGDVEINPIECDSLSYVGELFHFIANPPFDEVFLEINGVGWGGYEVNTPIIIEGLNEGDIEVEFYFFSEETDTICSFLTVLPYPCSDCNVECIDGEFEWIYECSENDPGFYLELYPFLECGTDSIDLIVSVNGGDYLNYNSAEPWIFDFVGNQEEAMTVNVCYADNESCCNLFTLPAPPCFDNANCAVDSVQINLNCDENNNYYLEGFAIVSNPGNAFVDVFIDTIYAGYYPINDNNFVSIFSDPIFNLAPNTEYEISVCVNDNPDCCNNVTVSTEICFNSCDCLEENFFELFEVGCMDNGNYWIFGEYASECDSSLLQINNGPGTVLIGSDTITISNIQPSDIPLISMCLINAPDCCSAYEWDQPQCFNNDDPVEQLVKIVVQNSEIIVETEEVASIGLIDIGGRLVRTHGERGRQHRLDTSGLTSGVYLLNIIEDNRIKSKKVFVAN